MVTTSAPTASSTRPTVRRDIRPLSPRSIRDTSCCATPALVATSAWRRLRWSRIARSARPTATSFMAQIVRCVAHLRLTGDWRLIYRSGE